MINQATTPEYWLYLNSRKITSEQKIDISSITFEEKCGYTSKVELRLKDSEEFGFAFDDFKLETPVEFWLGWYRQPQLLFKGQIVRMNPSFRQKGVAGLEVTAYDLSYLMKRPNRMRMHSRPTLLALIQEILDRYHKDYGLDVVISPTEPLRTWKFEDDETIVQDENVPDYQILSDLASKTNYLFLVREDTVYFVGTEYFANQQKRSFNLYYRPREQDINDPDGLVLSRFDPDIQLIDQKTRVEVISWNSIDASGTKRGNKSLEESSRGKKNFTEVRVKTDSRATLTIFGEAAQSKGAAQTLAEAELDRRARKLVKGQGSLKGWPYLRTGQQHNFNLRSLNDIGPNFSGSYKLTGVEHKLDDSGYHTRFDVENGSLSDVT